MTFLERLDAAAARAAAAGLTRDLRVTKAGELLDLAGNDYLGLRLHPAVIAGACAAAETHGGGAGASRLVTGTLAIHEELESGLAEFVGSPSALVLSTGYAANLAVLTALTDRDTLVISDAHAHASLIDGARLSRGDVVVARHNDVAHVRELLADNPLAHAVVVIESIYSVLGDAAPLLELVELTATTGAVLVVDEAHALGVLGPRGEGQLGALGRPAGSSGAEHVVATATLSKSLAAQGGAVFAHPVVRQHLVNTARPFIYDTGLAPASAGAALGALGVLTAQPRLAEEAREAARRLAAAGGLTTPDLPAAAVMSVPMPGPAEALAAVARASERGIRIGCFRPPSTPDGSSRLRITAHAGLGEDDLDHASQVLRQVTHG